jgi:hypothetical protein
MAQSDHGRPMGIQRTQYHPNSIGQRINHSPSLTHQRSRDRPLHRTSPDRTPNRGVHQTRRSHCRPHPKAQVPPVNFTPATTKRRVVDCETGKGVLTMVGSADSLGHGNLRTCGGVSTMATNFEGFGRQSTAGRSPVQSSTHGETHRPEFVGATVTSPPNRTLQPSPPHSSAVATLNSPSWRRSADAGVRSQDGLVCFCSWVEASPWAWGYGQHNNTPEMPGEEVEQGKGWVPSAKEGWISWRAHDYTFSDWYVGPTR